jgi:hypothetical protein
MLTQFKAAWLRLLPLAVAADDLLNRATAFTADVVRAVADQAQQRRKAQRQVVKTVLPAPPPKSKTRLLLEEEVVALRADAVKLEAELAETRRQLTAPRRSVTRILFGEASEENVQLRQGMKELAAEIHRLEAENARLASENQALTARLAAGDAAQGAWGGSERVLNERLGRLFAAIFPRVTLVDRSATFLVREIDYRGRVLELLRQLDTSPGSVRSTPIANGWSEFKFGKGSLYAVRVYLHHAGGGRYEVLLSRKQFQKRDFERLEAM